MGTSKTVIDISKFNTKIEYKIIKNQVDGVIIRAGYRAYRTGMLTEDPYFKNHIEGCIANNIPVGIYFFTTALNAAEGKEEAEYALKLTKEYKLSFPIFVDTEMSNNNHDGRSDKLGKVERTNAVVAFCETIKKAGFVPGIYASDSWFVTQLDYNKIQNYKLWVASYSRTPYRVKNYIAWQYTSTNTSISGTNGRVDTSYWYDPIGDIVPSNNTKPKTNPYLKPSNIVKKGMKGEAVKWVQWQLNEEGYNLKVDGDFGKKTLAAVKDYQTKHKLVVDGIVGPMTIASLVASSAKMSAPMILDAAALYCANAEIEENPKVKFEIGAIINVPCANLYITRIRLAPFLVVHGECEVLAKSKVLQMVRVKYRTTNKTYYGWIKYEDIADLFE